MNRRNDEDSVIAVIKALVLIVFLTIFFVFIAWVMSDGVEARPLPSDKKTMEELNSKKLLMSEHVKLASAVKRRIVTEQGASRVDQ